MIKVIEYCLPDIKMLEEKDEQFLIWRPDRTYIVLGASNQPEESLLIEKVKRDHIPVMKRPSGGQAVVITPNNLIISVVLTGKIIFQSKAVFRYFNSIIISVLENEGLRGLSMMGISDIAIEGKKISGSTIYRKRDKLLYHAVINLGEPASTFEKYLKHPLKEPDYRQGRKHIDFVTSLTDNGYHGSVVNIAQSISYYINSTFASEKMLEKNIYRKPGKIPDEYYQTSHYANE